MLRPMNRQYEYPPAQYGQHPPTSNGPQGGQDGGHGMYGQGGQSRYANTLQQPQQQQQHYQQHPQQQQQGQGQPLGQGQGQNANGPPNAGGSGTGSASAAGDAQSQANSGPGGQEMNLASVLHYLQSEWRRWERDRNEWEIERAEMRARIALLEGQRRSAENLKVDLLRRVKMLEYALRQERTKTVNTSGKSTIAPSRLSTLQDEDRLQREEKEGSGSEGSEEGSQDRPRVNGAQPSAMSRMSTVASRGADSPWKSIGAIPKDPKARARSREYLKQCLQEITYLTSPGALNPLPPQPPVSADALDQSCTTAASADGAAKSSAVPGDEATQQAKVEVPDRPRKTLPDQPPPSMFAAEREKEKEKEAGSEPAAASASGSAAPASAITADKDKPTAALPNGERAGVEPSTSMISSAPESTLASDPSSLGSGANQTSNKADAGGSASSVTRSKPVNPFRADLRSETSPRAPSSPARNTLTLPDPPAGSSSQPGDTGNNGEEQQILTAIYRPHSGVGWRDQLRAANDRAEQAAKRNRSESVTSSSSSSAESASSTSISTAASSAPGESSRTPSDAEQLQALTLSVEEDSGADKEEEGTTEKSWLSKRILRSHLDIVRTVTFAHGPGVMLATAGDDNTVKVWYMEAGLVMTESPRKLEIEPMITYRTHTAPITALAMHNPLGTLFSASLDSRIIAWRLPASNQDPYAPHDPSSLLQVLEGHTDAVWDLCLIPSRSAPSSSADGTGTVTASSIQKKSSLSASASQPAGNGAGAGGQRLLLVSASADGCIKVWDHSRLGWAVKRTISFDGASPTCLGSYALQAGKVLVGFQDGRVALVDVESDSPAEYFGEATKGVDDSSRQVNAVVCHSTWPAIFVGYEDGYIRIFNANTPGAPPKHEILAHPSPLTSLALSPLHPHGLISAAADCSIRVWDLNKRTSVQDCAGHRQRAGEGVTALARHPTLPILASAGADGLVRLWVAS